MQLAAGLAHEAAARGATQAAGRSVRVAGVLPPAGESYQIQPVSQLKAAQPALIEASPDRPASRESMPGPGMGID